MRLLVFAASLWLAGCSHRAPAELQNSGFSVRPFGERFPLADVKPQRGVPLKPVNRKSFSEITLAQGGAGQSGFNSIRVFQDGSGYAVVFSAASGHAFKVRFQLSDAELDQLVEAMQEDRIHQVAKSVASSLHDGSVGFVQIVTTAGSATCWMSNYFEPVAHLFPLCNSLVWHRVIRDGKLITPSQRVDGMTECRRVLGTD